MKPDKLTLKAFGPYSGEQTVDFGALGGQSFLLICGPVGAGKTALLDGICYALYGVTSGGERQGVQMRSHFAAPSQLTEVVLDFSVDSVPYRVRRAPEQGGRPAEAVFWKLGEEWPPRPVATGWNAVDTEVQKLLKLGPEQFCQSVILPQGQFRRFLEADPEEREGILAELFQTEPYKKFQERLSHAARRAREAAQEQRAQIERARRETGATTPGELQRLIEAGQEQLAELTRREQDLRRGEGQASDRAREAEGSQERYLELDHAYAAFRKLADQSQPMQERRERLEKARKLDELRVLRQTCARRLQEARAAQDRLEQARQRLEEVQAEAEEAEARLAEARQRQSDRQRWERRLLELEGAHGQLSELKAAEQEAEAAGSALRDLAEALQAGERTAHKLKAVLAQKKRRLQEIQEEGPDGEVTQLKLREATRQVQLGRQAEELKVQLARARRAAKDDRGQQLADRVAHLSQQYAELEESTRLHGAAGLAQTLEKGKPCPVCGSTRHPAPAHYEGEEVRSERLKPLRTQLEQARRLLEEHQNETVDKRLLVERLQARLDQVAADLGDYSIEALEDRHRDLTALYADTRDRQAEAIRLRGDLDRLRAKGKALELRQQQVREQIRQAEQKAAQARAVADERRRKMVELGTDPDELEIRWKEASSRLEALRSELERSQSNARKTGEALAAARAEAEAAQRTLGDALDRQREAQEDLKERLERAGLTRASELEPSEHGEAWIEKETAAVKRYEEDLAAARHRLERARKEAAERELQDPVVFRMERDDLRRELEQLLAEITRLRDKVAWMEQRSLELAGLEQDLRQLEERERTLERLSLAAAGQNEARLSYHGYVLGRLLEQILEATDIRLQSLSRGRYELKRGGHPLEVVVLDRFSGVERPVATLSGGESFLASLALALGLSDTIQARPGNPPLGSLFVDEGFGYLDQESLDLALNALFNLSQEGRLVAIVTQLSELRERLGVRLEVVPGPRGSEVQIV